MSDHSDLASVLTGPNDPLTMLRSNWNFGEGIGAASPHTTGAGSVHMNLGLGSGLGV